MSETVLSAPTTLREGGVIKVLDNDLFLWLPSLIKGASKHYISRCSQILSPPQKKGEINMDSDPQHPLKWPEIEKRLKIYLNLISNHEGGTQRFRAVAQNKAIQISFQMI